MSWPPEAQTSRVNRVQVPPRVSAVQPLVQHRELPVGIERHKVRYVSLNVVNAAKKQIDRTTKMATGFPLRRIVSTMPENGRGLWNQCAAPKARARNSMMMPTSRT